MGSAPAAPEFVLALDKEELSAFIDRVLPASREHFGEIVGIAPGHVRMKLKPTAAMLRPGNIVSGPAIMGFVDVAAYAVVLAHIGPVPMAVTNALNINFMRSCRLAPVIGEARLLKLGRSLATIDVRVWQESEDRLAAQATVQYSLPPKAVAQDGPRG